MAKNVLSGTVRSIIKSWVNCQNHSLAKPFWVQKLQYIIDKILSEIENEQFTGDFFRSGSSFCKLARRISLGLKIDRWGTLGLLHLRDCPFSPLNNLFILNPFHPFFTKSYNITIILSKNVNRSLPNGCNIGLDIEGSSVLRKKWSRK